MELIAWWADRPAWLRILIGMLFLVGGGLMGWFLSYRLGIVPFALGLAMLIFGGKDDSEKNGYHF